MTGYGAQGARSSKMAGPRCIKSIAGPVNLRLAKNVW